MNVNHRLAAAALLMLATGAFALGQSPSTLPYIKDPTAPDRQMLPVSGKLIGDAVIEGDGSGTCTACGIKSSGADCCGPMGAHGPIATEIYGRSGASFIISQTRFSDSLKTGYEVMGGGRSLFFNSSGSRAHVVDLGLSYTTNDGNPNNTFDFSGAPVTIRNLHRTAVSLALGQDWFLGGAGPVGSGSGCSFRSGFDVGGRYGTSHLDMNIAGIPGGYLRQRDTYAAGFLGVHLDLEVPMGGWTFFSGLRGEYGYSNLNLITGTNTSVHDINVLLNMGVRY